MSDEAVAEATTETAYDVMSIVAEESKPVLPDHHERRFAVSLIFPLNIARRSPNTRFGNYGDLNYLPPRVLIPIYTIKVPIAAEQVGGSVEGDSASELLESMSGQFDVDGYDEKLNKNVMREVTRSSKQCADIFMSDYTSSYGTVFGCDVFEKLQGLDYNTEAKRIYSTVLPVHDPSVFGLRRRTVLGFELEGPFLDSIVPFLEQPTGSIASINASDLTAEEKKKAHAVREQLYILAIESLKQCRSRIATKNSDIQKGIVVGYDIPNYRLSDAPIPPDLLMMAHGDIPPLQEEDMRKAQAYADAAREQNQGPQDGQKRYTLAEAKAELLSDDAFLDAMVARMNPKAKTVPLSAASLPTPTVEIQTTPPADPFTPPPAE